MRKAKIEDDFFIPIVRDGAIASDSTADGRNIPILILDCENYKNVINLIQFHENTPPGDVLCTLGINKEYAFLILEFERPVVVRFGIKFDLEKQGSLADGIVQSHGLYIQAGKIGDTIVDKFDDTKILIEVPPKTKIQDWDERLITAVEKRMRREGLSKKQAKIVATQYLTRMREIWGYRIK